MLDHRSATPSGTQMDGAGPWDRISNTTGWSAPLGSLADTADVPAYASAVRATDLARLPPTFIGVADAEIFRDEVVEYTRRPWLAGVPTKSHVRTGGCRGFYALVPELPFAKVVFATRMEWLRQTPVTAAGS